VNEAKQLTDEGQTDSPRYKEILEILTGPVAEAISATQILEKSSYRDANGNLVKITL
jgi:hypothetical protein